MKRYTVYICLLTLGILSSCSNPSKKENHQEDNSCIISPDLKKMISLETVSSKAVNQEIELTGSVSYDEDHLYSYQSLISGVIQKIHFKIGDYVQKGQILAEVKTTELSGQKSELLKAQAELKLARRKLTATQNLHNDGVASDKELLEAKNELASAQNEINRLQETLSLQGGNVESGLLMIKAPSSGYVVEKKITIGTQIDAGQDDLFILSDLKKIWVTANVYAAQLNSVSVGQEVEIHTIAYPDKVFKSKISRLSNMFDPEERVLKAIIEINNPQLLLKPSMMVSVNINQSLNQQAIAVPKSAVLFLDNAYHVMLYKTDCDVQTADILPIGSDRNFYYVAADRIKDNDVIINQNHLLIYNKLKER